MLRAEDNVTTCQERLHPPPVVCRRQGPNDVGVLSSADHRPYADNSGGSAAAILGMPVCDCGTFRGLSQSPCSRSLRGCKLWLKRPWPDRRTHLVLEPVAFLRRLVGIIPPPRRHLVRYAGEFGPGQQGT
ncbi:MAG: hypothetical protein E6J90_21730 [Deltaproteobacteria bacterium]|nr:MAG: hypothetical protein E6J91_47060 [Deltaproteobacteria bacterium]TMQ17788.1 MAG: hypothetical protein E6J90_21730 [Deltaproteobacteria bacterium]